MLMGRGGAQKCALFSNKPSLLARPLRFVLPSNYNGDLFQIDRFLCRAVHAHKTADHGHAAATTPPTVIYMGKDKVESRAPF